MFVQINVNGDSETINLNCVIKFNPYYGSGNYRDQIEILCGEGMFYSIYFTNPYAMNETYKLINSSILNNKTLITLDSSNGVAGFELIIK